MSPIERYIRAFKTNVFVQRTNPLFPVLAGSHGLLRIQHQRRRLQPRRRKVHEAAGRLQRVFIPHQRGLCFDVSHSVVGKSLRELGKTSVRFDKRIQEVGSIQSKPRKEVGEGIEDAGVD
jgi:hypothetical protein